VLSRLLWRWRICDPNWIVLYKFRAGSLRVTTSASLSSPSISHHLALRYDALTSLADDSLIPCAIHSIFVRGGTHASDGNLLRTTNQMAVNPVRTL